MKTYIPFFASLIATFCLTAIAETILIPLLRKAKMGQKILEIGPSWHKKKEGTPTMGGLGFIFAGTLIFLAMGLFPMIKGNYGASRLIITFVFALLCGCIGFIDDYAKFFKKQNEGLSAKNKYLLQLIVSGLYLFFMAWKGNLSTSFAIPFTNTVWDMGNYAVIFYALSLLLLTGIENSVNLTDGIDGLASSVTTVVGIFFALVSFKLGIMEGELLSGILIGGCLGFLLFNFHPAKVFMGDTGSLFLGGYIVGLAFLIDNPLIVILAGFVYICETLSVILQVASFKLTGKRIFKMSPIHHHFEKCGWSEVKIVSVFSLVTAIFCLIGYFGVKL